MTKAAGDRVIAFLTSFFNHTIYIGRVPNDCHSSYIFNLFKGKADALYCGNYRGLKLQEHFVEIVDYILSTNIGELGCIKNMQFGFMAGRGTTDLIFMLKKLQAEYLQIKKNIYFAFVDLEKAFDSVPHRIIWREMWKLRINEWIIQIAKSMYDNAHSKVRNVNS